MPPKKFLVANAARAGTSAAQSPFHPPASWAGSPLAGGSHPLGGAALGLEEALANSLAGGRRGLERGGHPLAVPFILVQHRGSLLSSVFVVPAGTACPLMQL